MNDPFAINSAPPEIINDPLPAPPPAPSAITDAPEEIKDREDAFDDEPVWNGTPLLPFSIERYSIFVSQRLSMNAPPLIRAVRDGAGFYPDAIRILWICSTADDELSLVRKDPDLMQALMDRWAADHCPIHLATEAVTQAISMFNNANVNRHASKPEPTLPGAGKGHARGN